MKKTYKILISILCCIVSKNIFAAENIPPVVVTKPYASSTPTRVISQNELAILGVTSLMDALKSLGGVQLQDTTGNGSQVAISMRGFGSNASSNTLLLMNGIPFTNPDIAPPDLNNIPIEMIDHIEIFSGSESVLYGDQAVGGVINVVTRKFIKNKISALCGIGSYQTYDCDAGLQQQWKSIQYAMNLKNLHTNNYREHNDYDQTNLTGNILYPYSSGSVELNYQIAKEKMLYPGALSQEQVDQDRRAANNDTDFFADTNGFLHLRYLQAFNDVWNIQTDMTRRMMSGNGVLFAPFTQSRVIDFIQPELKGKIGSVFLQGGVNFENDQYRLDTAFGETLDGLQKYGIYSLFKILVNEKFVISFGGRMAQQNSALQSPEDIFIKNRAYATTIDGTYFFTENISLYLRRAGSFRFPKTDEMAFTTPGTLLKTQEGVSYESGISSAWHKLTNQFSVYQLNLTNEITYDPTQTEQDPFGTNRNLPPTKRVGFSFDEKYQWNEKVFINGQYHYVNARFNSGVNEGKRIPFVAENIFNIGINYAFTENWNVYTEALYTGNLYPANDDANVSPIIGGYTIYNINWRYQLKAFTANFRINNLTNKFYNLYTVFTPNPDTESFYPAAGRNFLFTLKYEWG